jgi:carbon storage regulator
MLIMTRNVKQSLKIGPDITVAVIGLNGKQVRIGIDAPKNMPIHREEAVEKDKRVRDIALDLGP